MATTDDIFKCIFMNEKFRISLVDNKAALVQVMAWRRTGAKPLPEPILTQLTDAYICGTRGGWVNREIKGKVTFMSSKLSRRPEQNAQIRPWARRGSVTRGSALYSWDCNRVCRLAAIAGLLSQLVPCTVQYGQVTATLLKIRHP